MTLFAVQAEECQLDGALGAAQLLANPSHMASQSLWALFDLDRPEVLQKARGDALRHQSRNMCSQLV